MSGPTANVPTDGRAFCQRHSGLKVSVIAPWSGLEKNALFESRWAHQSCHSPNVHWMDCFAAVHARAAELGIEIGTDDILPPEEADIIIHMAQAKSPRDVIEQKYRYRHRKAILVTYETSLGARYTFNPANHTGYDIILTYKDALVDHKRYFPLPPRAYDRRRIRTGLPFEKRRTGCLIGTNRRMTYRSGLFAMRNGWKFSWKDWFDYVFCPGQLITYRSLVGRACAEHTTGTFDVFGEGWEMIDAARRFCLGVPAESTLSYLGNYRYDLAFENHSSNDSLISERIWDALWADSVPVYLGNNKLTHFIPAECFIDARQFGSPKEMLDWLARSSEETWSKYREAGREFIHSAAVEKFLPDAFAETFLRPIRLVADGLVRRNNTQKS